MIMILIISCFTCALLAILARCARVFHHRFVTKKIHSQSFLSALCAFFVVHFSFADDGGQNEASENKSKSDSLAAVERNDERKFKLLKIYESALL